MLPVVLMTVDCLRADHLGCLGYNRPTSPNIDEFATSATVYTNSYANCPGTRWALQTLHTGLPTNRIDGIGVPDDYQPLASYFQQAEYTTGGFVNNGFGSREYGYDTGFDTFYSVSEVASDFGILKQFGKKVDNSIRSDILRDRLLALMNDFLSASTSSDSENKFSPSHSDEDTVNKALDFIHEHQGESYFLWVHLMDAHTPYGYWPEHLSELRGDADINHVINPGAEGGVTPGEGPSQEVIDTYDAGIRSADQQIGRVLSELSDDATVVITGDHGEELGHYGYFHWTSFYSSMTQIPIIIRDSELKPDRQEMPVQHLDIPPTLLHSAGVESPEHWEGDTLQTTDRGREHPIFFVFNRDRVAVRTGDWKFISDSHGDEGTDVPAKYRRQGSKLFSAPDGGPERENVENEEVKKRCEGLVEKFLNTSGKIAQGHADLEEDDDLNEGVSKNLEDLGYL